MARTRAHPPAIDVSTSTLSQAGAAAMLRAEVLGEVCQGCEPCSARRVRKAKALMQFDPGEMAVVDRPRCRGCATCLPACRKLRDNRTNQKEI